MASSVIPQTYEEWRHCITVDCGIPLTPEFVARRLAVWRDADAEETERFRDRYGAGHLQAVIHWFEQAQTELDRSGR